MKHGQEEKKKVHTKEITEILKHQINQIFVQDLRLTFMKFG